MTAFAGTFTVTSTYGGYSGHTSGGLRDGSCTGATSVWGSNSGLLHWIKADLGSIVTINDVGIGPINSSFDGWGPSYTDGRLLQISDDDSTWTTVHTLSGHANNTVKTYTVSASGRYVRILYSGGGNYLGVGDFQINYTSSSVSIGSLNLNSLTGRTVAGSTLGSRSLNTLGAMKSSGSPLSGFSLNSLTPLDVDALTN